MTQKTVVISTHGSEELTKGIMRGNYTTTTISQDAYNSLISYLKDHEGGIACDLNDFGDLRLLFLELMGRDAGA